VLDNTPVLFLQRVVEGEAHVDQEPDLVDEDLIRPAVQVEEVARVPES